MLCCAHETATKAQQYIQETCYRWRTFLADQLKNCCTRSGVSWPALLGSLRSLVVGTGAAANISYNSSAWYLSRSMGSVVVSTDMASPLALRVLVLWAAACCSAGAAAAGLLVLALLLLLLLASWMPYVHNGANLRMLQQHWQTRGIQRTERH